MTTPPRYDYERSTAASVFYALYVLLNIVMVGAVGWILYDWSRVDYTDFQAAYDISADQALYFDAGITIGVMINIGFTLLAWGVLAFPLRWLSRPRRVP